jgi:hypothetical protein
MIQPEQPDHHYLRAAARALRPQRWLRVHLPLLMPYIDRVRSERLTVDLGDGRTVELHVRPEYVPRAIAHFDQIEPLLAPDQAETDLVEPLAHALVRLSRGDEA